MKPRIKVNQTPLGFEYNYANDVTNGYESLDFCAIYFLNEIEKIKKPDDNQTGLGWWIIFTASFLGSLAVEIASLYW